MQQLKMIFWIHLILLVFTCQLQAATGRRRSQPITIHVRVRPAITSVSPQQGTTFGGTAVTIVDTNFALEIIEYVRSYKQSNLSSKEKLL